MALQNDTEMLDWLEENGEEIYTIGAVVNGKVETVHCLKYLLQTADHNGEYERIVKGTSLRNCIEIATKHLSNREMEP